jgi:hypothetical protein
VLGRGVSEGFLVAWWRRSNRPHTRFNRPHTRFNRPLWTAGFRVVSAVVGACVLRLLVVFGPRTVALQWLRGFGKQKVEVQSV